MGGPEDAAAEKHFTQPTLTQRLNDAIYHADDVISGTTDAGEYNDQYTQLLKNTFKGWLRTVGLPERDRDSESIRELLIALVDEP